VTDSLKLNATAYSLLGLIGKRSWSAYELTEFMSKSVIRFILPRSASQLYNEPKKLAKLGLIQIEKTPKGKRHQTQYHITPAGKTAFLTWLNEAGEPPKVEYKSLLKFYLVDPSDTEGLRRKAKEMREETLQQMQATLLLLDSIINKKGILPDTILTASMSSRFGVEQYKARMAWLDQLDQWLEQPPAAVDIEDWSMSCYRQSQQQLKRLLKKYQ
jgi:DNA-binding PadR family transcriptional regulator